jgi:hypothetical protein
MGHLTRIMRMMNSEIRDVSNRLAVSTPARRAARHIAFVALAVVPTLAATRGALAQPSSSGSATLSDADRKAGWRLLFDGASTNGWRGYKMSAMPPGWHVSDGTLAKEGPTGDIVTTDQFGNFELQLEWKIASGGNSGVFYRGTEQYDHIYWSAPEYQLLDDANAPDGKSRLTAAGADYALYPSPAGIVKAAGEWNSTRIVVRGSHVEHWLNGKQLLSYELGSPDWEARVKASKFSAYPGYGRSPRGYIAIQGDHAGSLALRNIRIRELQ